MERSSNEGKIDREYFELQTYMEESQALLADCMLATVDRLQYIFSLIKMEAFWPDGMGERPVFLAHQPSTSVQLKAIT